MVGEAGEVVARGLGGVFDEASKHRPGRCELERKVAFGVMTTGRLDGFNV